MSNLIRCSHPSRRHFSQVYAKQDCDGSDHGTTKFSIYGVKRRSTISSIQTKPPQQANLATTLVLLDLLSSERNTSLSTLCGCSWLSLHPSLDLASHGKEGLFNVCGSLCRGFEELNTEAICELFALLCGHDTLCRQIGLVAH